MHRIAYFITPHGFGHAARASAIMTAVSEHPENQNNLILLPYRSGFNHADLVNAADAVVGKVGYSTIAEVYQSGVPFGYVPRSNFRETAKLVAFIEKEMTGFCIGDEEFKTGKWLSKVSQILSFPRILRDNPNGAHQTADLIRDILFPSKFETRNLGFK